VSTVLDVELAPGGPAVLRVAAEDPAGWAAEHRAAVRAVVAEHGAVLVRGLGLADPARTADVFRALVDELVPDRESFAHRHRYAEGVYSSSAWPANEAMCMHHELSYALRVPRLLLLACLRPAPRGGATGLADARAVLRALPDELVGRFAEQGWILRRSYGGTVGISWSEAFGSADRDAVEDYCRRNAIDARWSSDGRLVTEQRRPAVLDHPDGAGRCWFNQVAFLNEWTMAPEVRGYLVDLHGRDALPFTTAYGDGEPVGPDVVELINRTYRAHTVHEPWRAGDLMLVDNLRTAHERRAHTGERQVVVGMADPHPVAAGAGGTSR
jgi:alpha-ketoglutarate-dependent taurine dioxygenase